MIAADGRHQRRRQLPNRARPTPLPPRRWLEYLIAILIGNAVYFLALVPHLPVALRHVPFRVDAGVALDGLVCVAIYRLMRWAIPENPRTRR